MFIRLSTGFSNAQPRYYEVGTLEGIILMPTFGISKLGPIRSKLYVFYFSAFSPVNFLGVLETSQDEFYFVAFVSVWKVFDSALQRSAYLFRGLGTKMASLFSHQKGSWLEPTK